MEKQIPTTEKPDQLCVPAIVEVEHPEVNVDYPGQGEVQVK